MSLLLRRRSAWTSEAREWQQGGGDSTAPQPDRNLVLERTYLSLGYGKHKPLLSLAFSLDGA